MASTPASEPAQPEDREPRDWLEWHRPYDDPDSRLSRRLRVVQLLLRDAIDERRGPFSIVSMCAGQGRDVIGVLAGHPRRDEINARLVELDARNAAFARAAIEQAGLESVRVIERDAALTDTYEGAVPAEIVLACGIFGNISLDDIWRTIDCLPMLCAPGATVLWTRGGTSRHDVAPDIRTWFNDRGFEEVAYESSPDEDYFRVGAHRLVAPPRPLERGVRMFTFFR
jgi:hypothetical protein